MHFKHVLHTDYSLTTDATLFQRHADAKLCYGPEQVGDGVYLRSCDLLFHTTIEEQSPQPFCLNGQWMLFPVYGQQTNLPFDPLAATFYMVSRYEEHLPHRVDTHGRFCSEGSVAVQAGFADQPVVEQWALLLREQLLLRYPDYPIARPQYTFVQTVDIDAAWSYLHKGLFRTLAGYANDLFFRRDLANVRRRTRVLLHREADPFDTFDYIISLHRREPHSHLIFFALLADYGTYDKPSGYLNPHTRQLLQHLGDHAKMGLHPGYDSLDQPRNVDLQKQRLEGILHRTIVRSRYHYLRLQLPRSYRILAHAGLRHDYSMGYPDRTGFRAGISIPYPFYDLERDQESDLLIHPFCAMDTTLNLYLHLSPDEAIARYQELIDNVRRVGGTFCCIVHNQNLSELAPWQGWRRVYEELLHRASPSAPAPSPQP